MLHARLWLKLTKRKQKGDQSVTLPLFPHLQHHISTLLENAWKSMKRILIEVVFHRAAGGLLIGYSLGKRTKEPRKVRADCWADAGLRGCAGDSRPHRVAPAAAEPGAAKPQQEPFFPGAVRSHSAIMHKIKK